MEQIILDRLRQLPEWAQRYVLHYFDLLISYCTRFNQVATKPLSLVESPSQEHPLAKFYGICADDPIQLDNDDVDFALDDDMVGVFD